MAAYTLEGPGKFAPESKPFDPFQSQALKNPVDTIQNPQAEMVRAYAQAQTDLTMPEYFAGKPTLSRNEIVMEIGGKEDEKKGEKVAKGEGEGENITPNDQTPMDPMVAELFQGLGEGSIPSHMTRLDMGLPTGPSLPENHRDDPRRSGSVTSFFNGFGAKPRTTQKL